LKIILVYLLMMEEKMISVGYERDAILII